MGQSLPSSPASPLNPSSLAFPEHLSPSHIATWFAFPDAVVLLQFPDLLLAILCLESAQGSFYQEALRGDLGWVRSNSSELGCLLASLSPQRTSQWCRDVSPAWQGHQSLAPSLRHDGHMRNLKRAANSATY